MCLYGVPLEGWYSPVTLQGRVRVVLREGRRPADPMPDACGYTALPRLQGQQAQAAHVSPQDSARVCNS